MKQVPPPAILSGNKERLFVVYIIALVLTNFVPQLGAFDAMGSQWFYLAVVNLLGLGGLWFAGKEELKTFNNKVFWILGLLLLFCLLSIVGAVNRVESVLVLSRYFTSFFVVFLIYQLGGVDNKYIIRVLGWVLTLVCLVESLQILGTLYLKVLHSPLNKVNLESIISSDLRLNQGNKNFTASNLLQKIPFVLILLFGTDRKGQLLGYITFSLTCLAILVLNTRSTYVGLGVLVLLVNIFLIAQWVKTRKYSFNILFFNVLFLVGFFAANAWLFRITQHQKKQKFENVVARASTISSDDQGADRRFIMWGQAWDYTKKNPILGCGLGNWKITAIAYDKYLLDDYRISKHVHNDFLEMIAETGIAGGLAFLLLFVFALYALFRAIVRNPDGLSGEAVVLCLALAGVLLMYITDALLNFPGERTCNQINLAMALGLVASLPMVLAKRVVIVARPLLLGLSVVIALVLVWSGFSVFQSMKMQSAISADYAKQKPLLSPDVINTQLGNYPNLTELCVPVNYIKARYYLRNDRDKEAFAIFNNDKDPNPNLGLREGLIAEYFASKANYDSSLPYAKTSIEKLPRCRNYTRVFIYGCIAKKDSMALRNYFPPFIQSTTGLKAVGHWRDYAAAYFECTGNQNYTLAIIDSAIAAFPGQALLINYKQALLGKDEPKPDVVQSTKPAIDQQAVYMKLQEDGKAYFKNQDYDKAVICFRKSMGMRPDEISNYENLGLIYLVEHKFQKSADNLKKVIDAKAYNNGKAEFYYAEALINMKQMAQACPYLEIAIRRNFPGAKELKDKYCK